MNRVVKIAFVVAATLTFCSVPVFAASGVVGVGTVVPDPSTFMMLLGSSLFGSFYLVSRGRK